MPRLLEWIGHASVFQNPVVEYNLAVGNVPPKQLALLRAVARRRIYRPENGHVRRELRKDSPEGLSKDYRWGPDDSQMARLRRGGRLTPAELEAIYVVEVTDNDARIILQDKRSKSEFIDVTDLAPQGPAGTKAGLLVPPSGQVQVLHEEDLASLGALAKDLR